MGCEGASLSPRRGESRQRSAIYAPPPFAPLGSVAPSCVARKKGRRRFIGLKALAVSLSRCQRGPKAFRHKSQRGVLLNGGRYICRKAGVSPSGRCARKKGSLYITSLSVPEGEHSKTCFAQRASLPTKWDIARKSKAAFFSKSPKGSARKKGNHYICPKGSPSSLSLRRLCVPLAGENKVGQSETPFGQS